MLVVRAIATIARNRSSQLVTRARTSAKLDDGGRGARLHPRAHAGDDPLAVRIDARGSVAAARDPLRALDAASAERERLVVRDEKRRRRHRATEGVRAESGGGRAAFARELDLAGPA